MKWVYDLCGAEPIIKDMPAYDAGTLAQGELLMNSAIVFSAGTSGTMLISAYDTTVATAHAVAAIGIACETKTTASVPSVATAVNTTAAVCYIKTIVNPFAVYRSAYGTAESKAITSCSSTHLVATTGIGQDSAAGFFVYFSASAGPNFGHLGIVMIDAAASTYDLDAALTNTATTADRIMFISPTRNRAAMPLTPDALGVGIISTGTALAATVSNLGIVETWMDSDRGVEIMNYNKCRGDGFKKANNKPAQFFNDIVIRDHVWGQEG